MGATKIEWADETWNPVTGCTKVSQGCKHCYAERHWARLSAPGQPYAGRAFTDVRCHPERLQQPLRWRKPRRIFVNSMSDLFHEEVPFEFIAECFQVMTGECSTVPMPHTFQILTKRPERMLAFFSWIRTVSIPESDLPWWPFALWMQVEHRLPSNVWLGVSVENQEAAEERIPLLLQAPAAVRFVSAEPLLGPVILDNGPGEFLRCPSCGYAPSDISRHMDHHLCSGSGPGIHWVIVGGESGPGARPMNPEWGRSLRDQCVSAGVPFFFKQWGGANKSRAGRLLDGRTWEEYPQPVGDACVA